MKKKWKRVLERVLTFIIIYLLGSAVFIGLFHTPILKHLAVLMYRGIVFLLVSGITVVLILFIFRRYIDKSLEWKDIMIMFLMFCCINMVLFTLLPVTVERSVSVFILSYMADHEQTSYTEDQIEEVFDKYYVKEYGAVQKRFEEQEITGTIESAGSGYHITPKGKNLVQIFRSIAKLFHTDQRLLYSNE